MQCGITPVLRREPSRWAHWYMELGIGADEIELRAEHYSNGGIKLPNPGENWFQLRYMNWFKS